MMEHHLHSQWREAQKMQPMWLCRQVCNSFKEPHAHICVNMKNNICLAKTDTLGSVPDWGLSYRWSLCCQFNCQITNYFLRAVAIGCGRWSLLHADSYLIYFCFCYSYFNCTCHRPITPLDPDVRRHHLMHLSQLIGEGSGSTRYQNQY